MYTPVNTMKPNIDYKPGNVAGAYRTQQIISASPEKLILMTYDYVLAGCNMKDKVKASRGLAELVDALDFSQGDVAVGLLKLYQYAMDKIREDDFDGAASILRSLREVWVTALQKPISTTQQVG